jgi:hypothetical protein
MNYLVYIILLLLVLSLFLNVNEPFTVYQLNYSTEIEPNYNPKTMNKLYRRCICSSNGKCKCMFDGQFGKNILYEYE